MQLIEGQLEKIIRNQQETVVESIHTAEVGIFNNLTF